MTPNECELLIDRLSELAEYYEKPKSEAQIAIYVQALKDLPIAAVLNATSEWVKKSPWFPKVSDIRSAIEGETTDQAELAWLTVLREVRRVGYTGTPTVTPDVLQTIGAIWGTWATCCETLPAGGPELLGWAKQFKQTHRVIAEQLFRDQIMGGERGLLQ